MQCSVTCGRGVRTRPSLCQRMYMGELVNVTLSDCDDTVKPLTSESCNKSKCPDPKIKMRKVKFFQVGKLKRLKLLVGMEATILPDTSLILKCPHVGLDRQKVTWFKNGLKFKKTKGAKVVRSGALRIRRSFPGKDDGVYTCLIGGIEANLTIRFGNAYEILQATMNRDQYLPGKPKTENSLLNKTVLYKDPVDRKKRPLTLISTDWSRCSVTCGGGLQSRNLSCELITNDYYEIVPKQECYKKSNVKPPLIRSCNTNPCVRWNTGEWTEVSCLSYAFSIE